MNTVSKKRLKVAAPPLDGSSAWIKNANPASA
jgi:hypothetical protein